MLTIERKDTIHIAYTVLVLLRRSRRSSCGCLLWHSECSSEAVVGLTCLDVGESAYMAASSDSIVQS